MLNPLAVAALAMLAERSMHPYEMYQLMLQRRDTRLVKVRPGSLYHAIARLDRDGLAEVVGTERDGRRPERTTYAITDAGRAALEQRLTGMLGGRAEEYPEFPLALSQAHHLPAGEAVALLRARLTALREQEESLAAGRQRVTAKDVPERYWIDLDYQLSLLRAEIAWIERLIDRIDRRELPW